MHIVIEGPDDTGKSTLIKAILKEHYNPDQVTVVPSEGPEKYPGEILERITDYNHRYSDKSMVIFDRHPCVSQNIYREVSDQTEVPQDVIDAWLTHTKPLLVYCRPPEGRDPMSHHVFNPKHDSPEYLARVLEVYSQLLERYDAWALKYAHVVYRIGGGPRHHFYPAALADWL